MRQTYNNNRISDKEKRENGPYMVFYTMVGIIVLVLLTVGLFFHPFVVSGESMLPTYKDGQIVFTTPYKGQSLQPDDIIVFWEDEKILIKRIVATEGETVQVIDGDLYVNGEKIVHTGLEKMKNAGDAVDPYIVPKDSVFVLGDNRNNSKDSRMFGAVPLKAIKGIVR